MLSKTGFVAAVAAVALTLSPAALAAPTPGSQDQPSTVAPIHPSLDCKSLGKGTLGIPLNGIPPDTVPIPNNRIGLTPENGLISTGYNAPVFDYIMCNKGKQHEGFILDPNGKCVTFTAPSVGLKTSDCIFTNEVSKGGVDWTQHFQFQRLPVSDRFLVVDFAGSVDGPADLRDTSLWSIDRGGSLTNKHKDCKDNGPTCQGQASLIAALQY